ncbi:MAG: hypothetical protein R3F33_07545 [Planctomycetota bacterium]
MKFLLSAAMLLGVAAVCGTPCAAQTTYNRSISDQDLRLVPIGGGMVILEVTARCVSQEAATIDLGMDVVVTVDGVLDSIHPLAVLVPGGGGQTCGGSCTSPNCSDECVDLSQVGGVGCACTVVVTPQNPITLSWRPAGVVQVTLEPAAGALVDPYMLDDSASVLMSTTYNRWIKPEDVQFVPNVAGEWDLHVTVHGVSQEPGPIDLSSDVNVFVDGVLIGGFPAQLFVPGGGGQTCGGSCSTPNCPNDCDDLGQVGGSGCACEIVVTPGGSPSWLYRPSNTVTVVLGEAVGTTFELYTLDDQVTVPFNGPIGDAFCDPANAHCTGGTAVLSGTGCGVGSGLHLEVENGPAGQFGYFLVGTAPSVPGLTISRGRLCLATGSGNALGRYNIQSFGRSSIGLFNAAGVLQNLVNTSTTGTGFDVPELLPFQGDPAIQSGSTQHFQLWFRDPCPASGESNFSNGLSVSW